MSPLRTTIAAMLTAASLATACQILLGVEDEVGVARPPAEAGAETSVEAPCLGAQPPPPPSDDTGDGPARFFAVRTVAFSADGGASIGYNLDLHCTEGDADSPCVGSPTDGDGGIDNAFAVFVKSIPSEDDFAKSVNQAIAGGKQSFFMALYHYSGKEDDGDVRFAFVSSPGLVATDCDASVPTGPGEAGAPKWDGCDVWSIGDVSASSTSIIETHKGYVAKGVLVVPFDNLVLRLGSLGLPLSKAVLTATIDLDGGPALVDGLVAGQVRPSEVIQAIGEVMIGGASGKPLCELFPELLRHDVCEVRDLRLDGNRNATCDALSGAVGFNAFKTPFGLKGPGQGPPMCKLFDASCE